MLYHIFVLSLLASSVRTQNADCRLCSDGSDVPDSMENTTLFFLGGSQSCRTADEYLGRQGDAAACDDARVAAFGDQVVDVESFCGCPGVSPPALCTLCSQGGLVFEENEDKDMVLYDENVTFTCLQVEAMAEFINDQDVCDNGVKFAEVNCCSGQPMVPTPPTPPPTMAPSRTLSTDSPTASNARHVGTSVALAMGTVLSCWILGYQ